MEEDEINKKWEQFDHEMLCDQSFETEKTFKQCDRRFVSMFDRKVVNLNYHHQDVCSGEEGMHGLIMNGC